MHLLISSFSHCVTFSMHLLKALPVTGIPLSPTPWTDPRAGNPTYTCMHLQTESPLSVKLLLCYTVCCCYSEVPSELAHSQLVMAFNSLLSLSFCADWALKPSLTSVVFLLTQRPSIRHLTVLAEKCWRIWLEAAKNWHFQYSMWLWSKKKTNKPTNKDVSFSLAASITWNFI